MARLIAKGDALLDAATTSEEVGAALDVYLEALGEAPHDPDVLAALTRGYTLRGYVFPEPDTGDYETAREYGLRCLATDPSVASLFELAGGRPSAGAIGAVPGPLFDCLSWTTIAWSRWLLDRKVAGAAIDLEVVQTMARQALALADASAHRRGRRSRQALAQADLGLALGLPLPPMNPDLGAAQEALDAAIAAEPDRLAPRVDEALLVWAPRRDQKRWSVTLHEVVAAEGTSGAFALENRGAVAHARAALDAGLDPRWP